MNQYDLTYATASGTYPRLLQTANGYVYDGLGNTFSFGGPQGNQGPTGPFGGPQGFQGDQGSTGPQGFQGSTGPQGFQGNQGFQGPTGPQGFQGPQGPAGGGTGSGSQGPTGPQGFQGNQGNQGQTGPQGFQGSTGPQGFQGNQGFQGPTGPQGFQGNQGFQGPTGSQGFQGPTGNDGPQGLQGNQGFQGPSASYLSLPVPNIRLLGGQTVSLQIMDPATGTSSSSDLTLYYPPVVISNDFTEWDINNNQIFVEMCVYKRKSRKKRLDNSKYIKSGYVVPTPYYYDDIIGSYWTQSWPQNFWTRGGQSSSIGAATQSFLNKPNHYPVTSINQVINVYEYLNARFGVFSVGYRDYSSPSTITTTNCLIPISGRYSAGKNKPTNRFSYSPFLTPMYICFRYIIWDPNANSGRGQIISGPLSRTIKITNKEFPFLPDFTTPESAYIPVAKINPNWVGKEFMLKCNMEDI